MRTTVADSSSATESSQSCLLRQQLAHPRPLARPPEHPLLDPPGVCPMPTKPPLACPQASTLLSLTAPAGATGPGPSRQSSHSMKLRTYSHSHPPPLGLIRATGIPSKEGLRHTYAYMS